MKTRSEARATPSHRNHPTAYNTINPSGVGASSRTGLMPGALISNNLESSHEELDPAWQQKCSGSAREISGLLGLILEGFACGIEVTW